MKKPRFANRIKITQPYVPAETHANPNHLRKRIKDEQDRLKEKRKAETPVVRPIRKAAQ